MKFKLLLSILLTSLIVAMFIYAEDNIDISDPSQAMLKARGQKSNRNYKNAFEIFKKLLIETDFKEAPEAFNQSIECLNSLNKTHETDDFKELILKKHENNLLVKIAIASSYLDEVHYGYLVDNKFSRGYHQQNGGQYILSLERDRVRSLQILDSINPVLLNKTDIASYHLTYARGLILGREHRKSWVLQNLTDFAKLPEYDNNYRGFQDQFAPSDKKGNIRIYKIPETFEKSINDGERWRFHLESAKSANPKLIPQVDFQFASFLRSQWGVETLGYNWASKFDEKKEKSIFSIETLSDEESLCNLAIGVQRIKLPPGQNYITIFKTIIESEDENYQYYATDALGTIYENRRQFSKAAAIWESALNKSWKNEHYKSYLKNKLDQIVNNWGCFETMYPQQANEPANFTFRFRNATAVSFSAYKIDMSEILNDLIILLKSEHKDYWNHANLYDLGNKLVNENYKKYAKEVFATWQETLIPLPNHFDNAVQFKTPFKAAGAYLVKAKVGNGNESNILLFLNDTIILKKSTSIGDLVIVADAKTGKPLAGITLEFFGYKHQYINKNNKQQLFTNQFAEKTNEQGIFIHKSKEADFTWLMIARDDQGRFAYHGFEHYWNHYRYHHQKYEQNKTYILTDRPVYKPGQKVNFKAWNRMVSYEDLESTESNKSQINVEIYSPLSTNIYSQIFETDKFGGITGSFELPKDATLGTYNLRIGNNQYLYFQVEEYKKPEFEVKVELPEIGPKLGDKIKAKIKANYYFGAPVTKAKVKYKVLRTENEFNWYPIRHWDWLYGNGYGWLSYDCEWYPGWHYWGCKMPYYWWWYRPTPQPEVVMENEVDIETDGTIEITIDTKLAKELYGDKNHQYQIIAEVVDQSRRTIVGQGNIMVTSHPFKIFTWLDKGYYHNGDLIHVSFQARTANGQGVKGKGKLTLFEINYDKAFKPSEKKIETFDIDVDETGFVTYKLNAPKSGQYRLKFELKNESGDTEEGGILLNVYGDDFNEKNLRFNDIELLVDKNEYKPGEKIGLKINTNAENSFVLLFLRPENGIYPDPEIISMRGKTHNKDIVVAKKDMPNFFIEAVTIRDCKIHSTIREVIVPPENKTLNVEIITDLTKYKPGQESNVKIKVTDINKKPFVGSLAISVYDKAIEYISGGSNVSNIKEFFWKWRKQHNLNNRSNLEVQSYNIYLKNTIGMGNIGVFGHLLPPNAKNELGALNRSKSKESKKLAEASVAKDEREESDSLKVVSEITGESQNEEDNNLIPNIRKDFADSAYWNGNITTDINGITQVKFKMPENLSTWKINSWAMGAKVEVGFHSTEVVTTKDLLIRLQAPRFFVEKDEVVLSGIVHNYLKNEQKVKVVFQQFGDCISDPEKAEVFITVPSNGEKRVDWRVKVLHPGEAKIRMSALNEKESDAMEMKFPVLVHGMMKLESFSGVIRPEGNMDSIEINIPLERKPEESELIINYSPTLAGAMVDALPYLVDYPYGCTEQTLNKFIPTVITQSILNKMGLNLEDIKNKLTNLNAEEIGDGNDRAKGWKKWKINPVFDIKEVESMAKTGLNRLYSMQNSDGGWGWFYDANYGHSYEHTTATVVNGLLIAKGCGVAILQNSLDRGIQWLKQNQDKRINEIKKDKDKRAYDVDALVYKILADAGKEDATMRNYLLRDKNDLSVYSLTLIGLGLFKANQKEELKAILENIDQYLEEDKENQTAWLNLKNHYWWCWYGNDIEANAHYLKLLSLTSPKSTKAAGLVKYLLSNRKNATYWRSTRDTAICIEAIAEYWKSSGEMTPDMTVEVWLDGKLKNTVAINKENLFDFNRSFILKGEAVTTGLHKIELRKKGQGTLYHNTYVSYFTKEDNITKAGLNLRATRKIYRLIKDETKQLAPDKIGGVIEQNADKFMRVNVENNATVKSGDLLEVEITVESKNEYEYICIEDPKAAGFETVDVRSGYNGNALGAYVEFKNEQVVMFARVLGHGKFSISYKVRAEIPGKFSALPTKIYAMYSPELKGNSDENKITIID